MGKFLKKHDKKENISVNSLDFFINMSYNNRVIRKNLEDINYFRMNLEAMKRKSFNKRFSSDKNNLNKLISFFNYQGKFIKCAKKVMEVYSLLYTFFLNINPLDFFKDLGYLYVNEFFYNLKNNKNLINLKYLLNWVSL